MNSTPLRARPFDINRYSWLSLICAFAACMLPAMAAAQETPNAAAAADKPAARAATQSGQGDAALKARIESLEEQLVDMQVLVGTLESLARSGPAPAGARTTGGADPIRVDAIENQVRALTNQVQALSDQVRSMGGAPSRSEVAPPPPPVAQNPANSFETAPQLTDDAIGGLIENTPMPPVPAAGAAGAAAPPQVTTAALPPPGDAANPKQLYETAYGYLLQRDYGAAQAAFDDFLGKFPSDSLAGNAQYWLGETHFVRGQYKAAAGAFLKGYQSYAQSSKAPDSLLKLAMSLDRLGQKDAACASYSELNSKFPDAPQSVKARAQSERQRVGCP